MKQTILMATKAFLLLVAIYLLLGLVAYAAPDAPVLRHVRQTVDRGDMRDDYPKAIIVEHPDVQDPYTLDNFTDALILNQALHLRSEGPKGILLLPRHDEGVVQHTNLSHSIYGGGEGTVLHYGRYWHGSTFLARIMLFFTSYSGVRFLLYLLSTLMLLWGLARLWRGAGAMAAVAVAFALLSADLFVMQFSLQFVQVLLIALGAILWLARPGGAARPAMPFFVVGSLTAFLDLLTAPTLTLGLPLVALVALRRVDSLRRGVRMVVAVALWWAAGYVLTWLAKWGLATLLTGENIFADAYGQGTRWSEGGSGFIGTAISTTLGNLHWKYVVLVLALLVLAALGWRRPKGWPVALQFVLVALLPFAYFLVMARPAAHHAWFNYRALATSVAALLMAVASLVDWQRVRLWCGKFNKSTYDT